jgi:hypothetical protein
MSTTQNENIKIYDREEMPFGKSWEVWTEEWWNWVFSIPKDRNPIYDDSGRNCNISQNNPDVWFLAGAQSGSVKRSCSVSVGKAILVPIAVNECSKSEFEDETDLAECATSGNNVVSMRINVNGKSFEKSDLEKYHVKTGEFNLTVAPNNVFDASPGTTKAVSDGYWLFLQPPTAGKDFTLQLYQSTMDDDRSRTINSSYDVTYHLTIK